ncbi:hypothetical protein MNBD_GAMMA09-3018 [hydrothermal vent metagenome]|uniref:Myo-inositol 2-dehydrogenase n=1 Tax=hydrothermal vent metagenome TaxID=652676 RepID=A0A3B0XVE9_9ZZZZ
MKNKVIKLGFIGGGINSAVGMSHRIASQMDGLYKVTSGCFSQNREVNLETAEQWNIKKEHLYNTPESLFENEKNNIDIIVILTPTPSHFELVTRAIESGYAVICEKSLATSTKEINLLNKTVEKNNAFLMVTYNYTGYPMLRELQKIIKKGTLGNISQIHIEMPQEGFARLDKNANPMKPQEWRLHDNKVTTISLDLGIHLVHMIKFLSEKDPIEVVSTQASFGQFSDIIDNIMCIARYTDNLLCQIWYSKTALGESNGLKVRVYGTKGSAQWYQMDSEHLIINNQFGEKNIMTRASCSANESTKEHYNRFKAGHPAGFLEAFANHYQDLANAYWEHKQKQTISSPWVFSSKTAAEGLSMLEAIAISSEKHRWQKIQ